MKQKWIIEAYIIIAENGFDRFNVELLARRVNKSKSSFYYYFYDFENFKTVLLEHHFSRAAELAIEIDKIGALNIELINLFITYKIDFLFHKQLRVNREDVEFKQYISKITQKLNPSFLNLWIEYLELENQSMFANALYHLIIDNFFLRITVNNYNTIWLLKYIEEIGKLVHTIKPTSKNLITCLKD